MDLDSFRPNLDTYKLLSGAGPIPQSCIEFVKNLWKNSSSIIYMVEYYVQEVSHAPLTRGWCVAKSIEFPDLIQIYTYVASWLRLRMYTWPDVVASRCIYIRGFGPNPDVYKKMEPSTMYLKLQNSYWITPLKFQA